MNIRNVEFNFLLNLFVLLYFLQNICTLILRLLDLAKFERFNWKIRKRSFETSNLGARS